MKLLELAINWMVWDWRRWVLENLTDWESRAWPFPLRQLFLFRSELVALCVQCYLQQSRDSLPGVLHAFCGLCRSLPALLMQQGSLAVWRAASRFRSLCAKDRYCDRAVLFWRWELQLGWTVFSKMSVFLRRNRMCSELLFPLSFSAFWIVCVCF